MDKKEKVDKIKEKKEKKDKRKEKEVEESLFINISTAFSLLFFVRLFEIKRLMF